MRNSCRNHNPICKFSAFVIERNLSSTICVCFPSPSLVYWFSFLFAVVFYVICNCCFCLKTNWNLVSRTSFMDEKIVFEWYPGELLLCDILPWVISSVFIRFWKCFVSKFMWIFFLSIFEMNIPPVDYSTFLFFFFFFDGLLRFSILAIDFLMNLPMQ